MKSLLKNKYLILEGAYLSTKSGENLSFHFCEISKLLLHEFLKMWGNDALNVSSIFF